MAHNPKISPKVTVGGLAGIGLAVLVAALSAITPDMLAFAGDFTPVVYAAIGALVVTLGAYIKNDPDRDLPDEPVDFGPKH